VYAMSLLAKTLRGPMRTGETIAPSTPWRSSGFFPVAGLSRAFPVGEAGTARLVYDDQVHGASRDVIRFADKGVKHVFPR
jgi:hypothetical protein